MNKKFANPYVIFYPVLSRDGMPFPINKCLKEIQAGNYRENRAWRGNLVVAKYRDEQLSALMDANMADFPLLKNYLSTHHSPMISVSLSFPWLHTPSPQPSASLRRSTFSGLFEVIFHVLIHPRLRPRALAHTHTVSHKIHRSCLRVKDHRNLFPRGVSPVGKRFLVVWFNGGDRFEGELQTFRYRIPPANGAHQS